MTITASAAQVNATPVQTQPTSTTVTATPLLINGASIGPSVIQQATADEILFVSQPSGTIQADSVVEIQVSPNNVNFGAVHTFTNAQIVSTRGAAAVVKVGVGNWFRVQFVAGSTTGAGNGVTVRFRN